MRHIIEYKKGKYRIDAFELERLNMFLDFYPGISDSRRGFLMGNALVVGIVERLAEPLAGLLRNGGGQLMLPYAKPVLKWAGGKRQLISQIDNHLPPEISERKITTYVEPMVGGGAVFFRYEKKVW